MATNEQVEAVARQIERRTDPVMSGGVMLNATPQVIARAAIAAYEQTRPAVPSDEDVHRAYNTAYAIAAMSADADDNDEAHMAGHLAGIRAVREALSGAVVVPALGEESDRLAAENANLRMRVARLRGSLIATRASLPRHIADLVERDLSDDAAAGNAAVAEAVRQGEGA